ncbi:MAG TPA: four helix bundle protein [Gemmatimonadales bacterium]|jgi:hypothetical protein|nr:four helix bundle protein [Gemmatimonadales bacterium]
MKTHRDLLAWQRARSVAKGVIELSITAWRPQFAAVFAQVQRSSLSVQLNIAEGYPSFQTQVIGEATCASRTVLPLKPTIF